MDVRAFAADPLASDLTVWCALSAVTLVALILGGFFVLWRSGGIEADSPRSFIGGAEELGLLEVWRLYQSLRPAPPASSPSQPSRPRLVASRSRR